MEYLGYKALNKQPAPSVVDLLLEAMPFALIGLTLAVVALFGADAWAGLMYLMGY